MNNIPQIFNRRKIRQIRQRAAKDIGLHSFLADEVTERLRERLSDLQQKEFTAVLNVGGVSSNFAEHFNGSLIVNQDLAENMPEIGVAANEELLPYRDNSFDLVIGSLTLHLVNDFPGTLAQIRNILKKDGVFIASMLGGETLTELRQVMAEVEMEEMGGISPRVAPFSDVKTIGSILQRVGFADPVSDGEKIKVEYDNVLDLMHDLRGMGESSPMIKSGRPLTRSLIAKIDERYRAKFGGIIATFYVINITGHK